MIEGNSKLNSDFINHKQNKEDKIIRFTGSQNKVTQMIYMEITMQKLNYTLNKKINNSCSSHNITFIFLKMYLLTKALNIPLTYLKNYGVYIFNQNNENKQAII